IIFGENPSSGMKAVKNETQISGLKECHLSDGIAMTKFMFWLKQNIGSVPMTERSVQDRLEEERRKQPLYQGP
ncbi:aminopeptidase P family protein, partial [Phocaeicola vulgatus]|nr:aminopeptidase P family protein [Phocaeicola vulgatus]